MAKDIKVKLYSNSKQFNSEMSSISRQMKVVKSEFEANRSSVDNWGNQLKQSESRIKFLNQNLELQRKRVSELRKAYNDSAKTKGRDAKETQNLAVRLNHATAAMNKTRNSITQTTAKMKSMQAATRKTAMGMKQYGDRMNRAGMQMRSMGMSVGIVSGTAFYGLVRAMKSAYDATAEFESGMSAVKALSGATTDEMAQLDQQARDLGATTRFTATQATEGMQKLALAGWDATEIMQGMPGMLDLAAAGSLDLSTAADITSDTMQAFKLSADKAGHAADVFAYAQANANTNVEQLGDAMQYIAPVANSLGWELEESAAAVMKLSDAGIKGGKAGQAFSTSLSRLAKPTSAMKKEMKKLGMEFFDAEGNMKPLPGVMEEIEKGTKGMTKEQKASTLSTLFGAQAYKHWAILLEEGSESLADTTEELKNADGAAKEMADTMMDNAAGKVIEFKSAIEGLQISLTRQLMPAFSEIVEQATELVRGFTEMDESTQKTIVTTVAMTAAVLGVTTVVAGLVAAVGAFLAFAGPVGLAITAATVLLGGLAIGLTAAKTHTQALKEEQEKARQQALDYGENLSEGTRKGVQGYTDLYENAKIKMVELKRMSGDEAEKTVKEIQKAFSQMADVVIAELENQRDELTRVINEIYGTVGEAGKAKAEEVSDTVLEKFDKDIADYKKARDTINEIIEEYGANWQDYPPKIQQAYDEAYAIMDQGAAVFAGTQREMQSIQERIGEQGHAIQNKQAKEFIDQINGTYEKSLEAVREHYNERRDILDQGLAQGKISYDQHSELMKGLEANTAGMYADAGKKRAEAFQDLSGHLDKRGKLLDLATGKELERETKLETITTNYGLIQQRRAETDEEYYDRWLSLQKDTLKNTDEFAKQSNKAHWDQQLEFLESLGYTKDEAIIISQELVNESNAELGKGNDEAKEAGKGKGDAYKLGLDDTKEGNTQTAKEIIDAQKEELKKGDTEAYEYGKEKGKHHKLGLDDTVSSNRDAAQNFSKATDGGLQEGKPQANKHGKDKGNAHKEGLGSTKGINVQTATDLTNSMLNQIEKGNPESKKAGKNKGESHKQGIGSTKGNNITTAKSLVNSVLNEVDKGDASSKKSGKDKGTSHNAGLSSTKKLNEITGRDLTNNLLNQIQKGGPESSKAGKDKGTAHKSGLQGTYGANRTAAGLLSSSVTRKLGSTTDGGGGSKAGSLFKIGLGSWGGATYTAAASVASRGLSGLKSVKTSGAGSDFVSGFRGSISTGGGSVWSAAWSLGKSALSALKKSINSHSPSKETGQEGLNFVDGFSLSMDKNKKKAIKSASDVGRESLEAFRGEVDNANEQALLINAAAREIRANKNILVVKHEVENKTLENKVIDLEGSIEKLTSFLDKVINVQLSQLETVANRTIVVDLDGRQVGKGVYKEVTNQQNRSNKRGRRKPNGG
ncbi:tail tape measure protein [Virgibacillus phage Mimir87]|nr:tail tape measure protein [Virgibacillus phage Mimir87]